MTCQDHVWQRLMQHFADSGVAPKDWACGAHLGMEAALRHPEWARSVCDAIDADMRPGGMPTSEFADILVEKVPLEVS